MTAELAKRSFRVLKDTVASIPDPRKRYQDMTVEELMANGGHNLANWVLSEMPYDEYLQTNHWKSVKEMAFRIHGKRCFVCGSTWRVDVHHVRYHRGEEKADDVFPLCREHHNTQHEILKLIAEKRKIQQ